MKPEYFAKGSDSLNSVFKRTLSITSIIFFGLVHLCIVVAAQPVNDSSRFPHPKGENLLFFLQRTKDANTIVYEANYKNDGTLNRNTPVKSSWIRYTEQGKRKDLNAIEEKFAYGIEARPCNNNEYELRLAAYKKLPLYLKQSAADNKYHTYLKCNGRESLLIRVFVQVNGGSFWNPNVEYIELVAKDTSTGKEFAHRIRP